jgi:hypothetical protein
MMPPVCVKVPLLLKLPPPVAVNVPPEAGNEPPALIVTTWIVMFCPVTISG